MKIDSYNIGMESERLYMSFTGTRKFVSRDGSNSSTGSPLSSFTGLLGEKESPSEKEGNDNGEKTEKLNPSEVVRKALYDLSLRAPGNVRNINRVTDASDTFQKLHEMMIRQIIELLFGKRSTDSSWENGMTAAPVQIEAYTQQEYTEYTFSEREEVSFNAQGIVKTSDGREININLDIGMTREFSSTYSEITNTEFVRLCDPLVINFDDVPAGLSDMKFLFDLDCNGVDNEISYLTSGSGFLALDKNGDGVINDGSELFGTKSGDGFKDLSLYDSDGNGWIDENDEIFNLLKIWVMDSNGNSALYSLKDKNVGAIYLGNAETQFNLNSHLDNSINGRVRKTGLFLYESGEVGSVQHIDLVS